MQLVFATSFVSDRVIYALSWTLLHSLWQGMGLALVVGILLVLTRKSKASVRYNLLSLCFLLFVIGVGVTYIIEWQQHILFYLDKPLVINYPQQDSAQFTALALGHYWLDRSWLQDGLRKGADFFDQHTFFITAVWMGILGLKSIKMGLDLWSLRRMRILGTQIPNLYWRNRLDLLATQLKLSRPVQLLESTLVQSPAALGYFKPLILVPLGLLNSLPTEQVEAILLHELAHIRRSDYLINFVQCLFENVFFFNPGLLWVSN